MRQTRRLDPCEDNDSTAKQPMEKMPSRTRITYISTFHANFTLPAYKALVIDTLGSSETNHGIAREARVCASVSYEHGDGTGGGEGVVGSELAQALYAGAMVSASRRSVANRAGVLELLLHSTSSTTHFVARVPQCEHGSLLLFFVSVSRLLA
jgi:hypothetical protein